MGRESMQGTPWHKTYLSSNEETKRHRSRCIHYEGLKCDHYNIKCFGSAHCDAYEEFKEKDQPVKKKEIKVRPLYENKIICGSFDLQFIGSKEIRKYCIGKNADSNSSLVKLILPLEQNSIFVLCGKRARLVSKNIYLKDK